MFYALYKVAASTKDKMPITTYPYKYHLVLRLLQTPLVSHWTLPLRQRSPNSDRNRSPTLPLNVRFRNFHTQLIKKSTYGTKVTKT
jgi:hypothetical protein